MTKTFRHRHHPLDADLQRAVDGELPAAAARALRNHVERCSLCDARMAAFESASTELHAACTAGSRAADDTSHSRARAQLARRMRETSAALDASWYRRLVERVIHAPAPLRVGVAAMAIVAGVNLVALTSPLHRLLPSTERASPSPAEGPLAALPLAAFTPGAASSDNAATLCARTTRPRVVLPDTVRRAILHDYGLGDPVGADGTTYELDYLITPELGGTAEQRNLWPEPYQGAWNARVKDRLETALPRLVCDGQVDLQTAQRDIAEDWIAAYRKYLHTDRPIEEHAPVGDDRAGDDDDITFVSVNAPAPAAASRAPFVQLVAFAAPEPFVIR